MDQRKREHAMKNGGEAARKMEITLICAVVSTLLRPREQKKRRALPARL
jgi:hypothetical protein